ncbi:integral membrane channel protein [Coccidioides immitis RS]|uniref:Integral membrane channel protein n=1 Tax=Coccidioides immitis (strain RS) TaxID=246410 RepID=A0A0E1RUW0_COCIM|nr:integral membrane channel protein [Coccidioides immitis RS]EAS28590.1 integral membrane channel protein [Coccidioides immitis RS]
MSAPSPIAARRMMFHGPLRAPRQSNQPAPNDEEYGDDGHGVDCETNDGHDTQDTTPLLPIFSAPHLDSLPVYHLTYDLCLLVASRCETTLTWEQLRSPQVSQFLLKPILQAIHTAHFSRATLYSLMANCLQFRKEADIKPGISGASHTRAMVCELLAIKLLKEYSTRELIDALSYDFHPLQGQTPPSTTSTTAHETGRYPHSRSQRHLKGVRISCLEVAIRAQAKRFLAHPLVVQQLEAIWAGTIVFYSAADHLHRLPLRNATRTQYGSLGASVDPANGAYTDSTSFISRRSASLYDPQDASLFKLSRLRVPRYRQVLSTCSFAVLLCLFLTVIQRRSFLLTTLELVFWFWSAGYMLDEIVGFNEQGFSLYLMSFWNTFDVGILFLLFCYYCLRLYSVLLLDHTVAILAYDVLAATAVLLVPRLFSVLDHYRYFSQLLIAFRMMAVDLFAVLILIIIACSGFFVAFTFSFGHGDSPSSVIYALFQMIMGFTPAAWQLWDRYNPLGKAILILFLFICHFLVVTILITVLTNSFMAIVQNANEEHQFLFAVNTISMVKSDALFSYIAPANIVAWVVAPLRFVMPFRSFMRLNRTIIKATHFPILFSIYLYERIALRSAVFEPTDLVDGPLRPSQSKNWVNNGNKGHDLFALGNTFRLREPSIATHQKDEALEQVFRRPFRQTAHRVRQDTRAQHKSNAIVSDWMRDIGPGGIAEPPDEEDQAVLERLEQRRILCFPGARRRLKHSLRDPTITTRSVASDPEDFVNSGKIRPKAPAVERGFGHPLRKQLTQQTDMEGDDELSSDHQQDDEVSSLRQRTTTIGSRIQDEQEDLFNLTNGPSSNSFKGSSRPSTAKRLSRRNSPNRKPNTPRRKHSRNLSSATVLLNPLRSWTTGEVNPMPSGKPALRRAFQRSTPPTPSRSPKEKTAAHTGPRPIHPSKPEAKSVPNLNGVLLSGDFLKLNRGRSSIAIGLGSDLGDNKAVGGGFVGGIPASFATQMAYATGDLQRNRSNTDHRDTLNRLVLARMKTLEESFRDVIREVKDLRREQIYPPDIRGNMASKANIPTSKRQYIEYHSEDGGNNTDLIFDDSSSELKASSV